MFNFKQIALASVLMLAAIPVFAEKPFAIAINTDQSVPTFKNQQDSRIASLALEYYKSEIATHSRLVLCDFDKIQDAFIDMKHKAGTAYTAEEVKNLLAQVNGDYLSLITVVRNGEKMTLRVTIYDKDGKAKEPITEELEDIRESDLPAVKLAVATARAIRGDSPVDRFSYEREESLLAEAKEDMQDAGRTRAKARARESIRLNNQNGERPSTTLSSVAASLGAGAASAKTADEIHDKAIEAYDKAKAEGKNADTTTSANEIVKKAKEALEAAKKDAKDAAKAQGYKID